MQVKTTCNRDCPDACGMVATVEDGRVIELRGDPDHPVTRAFLCYRTNRFLERQYDPERVTRPLLRRNGTFEPVSWNEALDRVASTMLRIREESGGAAIMNYRCGGSLGIMKAVCDFFFERFGPVTIKSGDVCAGAGKHAQELDFGVSDSNDLHDLLNSRTIILWGKNPHVSNVHLLPVLREAKQRGARLAQIDPVRHRGADLAELYLQPSPGADMAVALGVIGELFRTGRTDPQAGSYCDNLERLERIASSRDAGEWAALADVPRAAIERLTDLYAAGPSAILVGWGMQRRGNGCATVRVLDALCAVSGNLGVAGGGVSFYFKRQDAFDVSFLQELRAAPRAIPEPLLGPGILAATDPPVRMVWVSNANPVAMLPESLTVARALRSRELTVVVDAFMTDTARQAHLVLPATTMLEDEDLVGAYGHHYVGNVRPVVPPPEGVRTDYGILQALAPRVGLSEEFADSAREWKRRLLRPVASGGVTLEALEEGARLNPRAKKVLFADRVFATASGKVDLIRDVDPSPPRGTAERPLLLMALASRKSQASQWPSRLQRGRAQATVHPDAANGFREGQTVRVESEHGAVEVELRFDPGQRKDVLLMDKGGWLVTGRCANVLVRAELTDAGQGAVYYETPVRLAGLAEAGLRGNAEEKEHAGP